MYPFIGKWSASMTFVKSLVVVTTLMAGPQIATDQSVTADTFAELARTAPHGRAIRYFAHRREPPLDDPVIGPFTSERSSDPSGTSKRNAF